MSKEKEVLVVLEVPEEIKQRLNDWRRYWYRSSVIHYGAGILGILCSTFAATGFLTSFASVISAVCFGVIGFAKPLEKYNKYVQMWRKLDSAAYKI